MPLVWSVQRPPHRVLLIGTRQYGFDGWNAIVPQVEHEIALARDVFVHRLEYSECTEFPGTTDSSLGIQVRRWSSARAGDEAAVNVVYYTGHGHVDAFNQLRLITSDIEPGSVDSAFLATELLSALAPLKGRTLLIVDTCYSGAVAAGALQALQAAKDDLASRIQFITSARRLETAGAMWFMDALAQALDQVPSRFDEWLPVEKVIAAVNRRLAERTAERVVASIREQAAGAPEATIAAMIEDARRAAVSDQRARFSGSIEGLSVFFPNRTGLEFTPDMSRERALQVLHICQRDALRSHWDPRARAVSQASDEGWYFAGRHTALARLKTCVGSAAEGLLAVTGMAGSGKSALLSRFVTLADEEQRKRAEEHGALTGVPPDALPDVGSVAFAVYARRRSDASLAMEIATAAGAELAGAWEDDPAGALVDVLQRLPRERRVIVVDALDEARDRPAVAFLLQRLAHAGCGFLVIVGLRTDAEGNSDLLGTLGGDVETLNLDSEEYWAEDDLALLVERTLLTSRESPYAAHPAHAREVALAVAARAKRSFLVAVTTSRWLVTRGERLDPADIANLPSTAGEAFDCDLRRYGSRWQQGRWALGLLAFGRGSGLPRRLWPDLLGAFEPGWRHSIEAWERDAGFYIVRSQAGGEEACRLYHDEFARHLQETLDADPKRCRTEGCPHASVRECVASSLLDIARRSSGDAIPGHLLDHLPGYLADANMRPEVYELATAEWWQNAQREAGRDATHAIGDLAVAIEVARREPADLRSIARFAGLTSRHMWNPGNAADEPPLNASVEAPPVVIETLARAGQMFRARSMADNVLSPLDRCVAHARLAHVYAEQRRRDEGLACVAEARRSALAVRAGFRAMAFCAVARAALALGEEGAARRSAAEAMPNVDVIPADGDERFRALHDVVWAGLCLRDLRDRARLDALMTFAGDIRRAGAPLDGLTNLSLQAACVVGDREFLLGMIRRKLAAHPDDHPWPGNLELALVDAGLLDAFDSMEQELRRTGRWLGPHGRNLSTDSGKRFVWALALRGRLDEALQLVHEVTDTEERARALYRIAGCLPARMSPSVGRRLADTARTLLIEAGASAAAWHSRMGRPGPRKASRKTKRVSDSRVETWRVQSWLAPVFLVAGEPETAVDVANRAATSYVADPHNSLCLPVPATARIKYHMRLELEPTEDQVLLGEVQRALDANDPLTAEPHVAQLRSQRVRARAAAAVAARHPDPKRALDLAIDALRDASRCGPGELKKVLHQVRPALERSVPDLTFAALEAEIGRAL